MKGQKVYGKTLSELEKGTMNGSYSCEMILGLLRDCLYDGQTEWGHFEEGHWIIFFEGENYRIVEDVPYFSVLRKRMKKLIKISDTAN